MRIGLVSSDPLYFPGGVQEQVKGLNEFLKSKGYDSKILAPRHRKTEKYGKNVLLFGQDIIPLPLNASTGYVSFCFNLKKLESTLKKEDFDIIHFHNIGLFMPIQILNLSESKNILTLHALPEASVFYKFASDIIKFWVKTSLSKSFESVIATSKPVLENVENVYNGPTYIVPNGIDLKKFNPHNKKIDEFLDGKINILFVGRFDKRKGLKYLISAFEILKKKHENIRLIIVGGGMDKPDYEELVKQRRIKDVVFVGYIDSEEIPKYYATCDIFCSPAVFGEGFGVVLLEAMASGKPVVGFANTGYKQVVTGEPRRFLVKPADVKELIIALETLIVDEKLREKMGKWGMKEVRKYSWEKVGKQILEVYKKVV